MIRRLTKHLLVRYVISGGISAVVDLTLLYLFDIYMHYLVAAALALFVSFTLQKFWTFKDHSTDGIHKQTVIYLGTSLFGLSLNTLLMYIFVDYIHVGVISSQVFAGGLVACCTFFISRDFVFKYKKEENLL